MQGSQMSSCCGLTLLRDFGNTVDAIDGREYTVQEVDEFLRKYDNSYCPQLVTLNESQYKKLGKLFKVNNFKVLRTYYYSGHQNNIYIMLRMFDCNKVNKK